MILPQCLGIPVRYDPHFKKISDSRGLWGWKEIVVGPAFTRFPPTEQQAILLHEVGHCKLRHLEKRLFLLWLILWSPAALADACAGQEFEADAYAGALGFGRELARALSRLTAVDTPLHPPIARRIERLTDGLPTGKILPIGAAKLTPPRSRANVAENLDRAGN